MMELLKRIDYQPIVDTRELEIKSIKRCIEFQNKDSNKKIYWLLVGERTVLLHISY